MWNRDVEPGIGEKAISALCYFPMGFFIGIGYILFNGAGSNNKFFRFNFFQSIILQILITIIQMGSQSVTGIFVSFIKAAGGALGGVPYNVIEAIYMTVGIFVTAFSLLLFYGIIWTILGKYAEIPFISDVVRQNLR